MNVIEMLAKKLGIYLAAVLTAYLLASASATQSVVASLSSMGVPVGLGDRVVMTLGDVVGMAGMFLPLVAFALLVAFLFTALLCRWLGRWRTPLYLLAGATALVAMHLAMNLAFDLTPVAIARSTFGLLVQGAAGAAGGFVYVRLNGLLFGHSPLVMT
ncbi:MAG: hypothetical protein V2I48_10850 [Xanthomonadales bacterium]|jgi:hypothetical protein|nr:hypothetical protein [Xanthomonadales bacterium]